MLVIGAAASVTSIDNIQQNIDNWRTDNLNAKDVLNYCTSKTLGGFTAEEVGIIAIS